MSGCLRLELFGRELAHHPTQEPVNCVNGAERETVAASGARCKIDVERFVE
jgi:hypothetical protein